MKTLRQVCELTGVDRHVLQRLAAEKNKKKPLLSPSKKDESSGYWYYDDDAIERLWLILLFRELNCTFNQIQEIIDTPDFNQREWFEKLISFLEQKKEHLDKLINIAEMIKTTGILPTEYEDVKKFKIHKYLDRAQNMINSVTDEDKNKFDSFFRDKAFIDEFDRIVSLKKHGTDAADIKVQKAVQVMQNAFIKHLKLSSTESVSGLSMISKMFLANGDFSARFDEHLGVGVSAYVGEAINIYCNQVINKKESR